ncbi:hypothetical protein BKA63DRAFT_571840 [Paraphoma chrysanthemicola]|nr:hypothetical protein BKA63DRAFT_571840 [Paraphoma chrysanthemicola]
MSTDTKDTPPVPPVGAPCWVEIMSSEPSKLKDFYAALFPAWNFKPVESDKPEVVQYTFEQPSGLSGGIVRHPESRPKLAEQPLGGSTVYYYVNSIEEMTPRIVQLGGREIVSKEPVHEYGWSANFVDPEGNRFALFEANWGQK